MRVNGPSFRLVLPVILVLSLLSGCKVYTINKVDLETGLKSSHSRGLSINHLYKKQYKNGLDTVVCMDEAGKKKLRRMSQDSKVIIYTRDKSIRYYVKSLYIYKDEYLIGERTAPKLYGPNYFPVKLSEIDRIEVKGY